MKDKSYLLRFKEGKESELWDAFRLACGLESYKEVIVRLMEEQLKK